MILKFVMRDAAGAVVSDTPTVTADGVDLTPTGTSALWQVDAPLGSLVSATLTGALPLDVMMPSVDVDAIKVRTDTLYAATGTLPLKFRLLLDSDGDGTADVPAVGVGGIVCHLLDSGGTTRIRESVTTDSQGYAYWHGLAAGTYVVDPDDPAYKGVTVSVTIPE